MTDPASTAPTDAIEYGVQWTPSRGQPRVETSPIAEAHAESLARRLRRVQLLFEHDPDAVVVYRAGQDGEWSTTRPGEVPPRPLSKTADELLQECLNWLADPDMPTLIDDPTNPLTP
ncbi:hypothetical protein OG884_18995 [Streptosporangium sp. NBC_01755]|uniref:hypothetical protein n=1 Tax=Streptosporangium sp. NBC_01755 TaxID=2975949 RepID=UPI002DDB6F29|nr:hypothetical protein [Streptosporangium sp. NBC_01755]WSD03897.1 hypothetical protein OG884_18995 [Streptosporangium sp. NBC_01755]